MFPMANWKQIAETLESSYVENGYGQILYDTALKNHTIRAIEIGCYQGYSTIYIAAAINNRGGGELEVYDAWDWYKYKHCLEAQTRMNVKKAGFHHLCKFKQAFALNVQNYLRGCYDLVHIDISNDGDIFEWATSLFSKYIPKNGLLILEGGSEERDRVEWMTKYNKMPIHPLIERGFVNWEVELLEPFPSMTIMRRI